MWLLRSVCWWCVLREGAGTDWSGEVFVLRELYQQQQQQQQRTKQEVIEA